MAQETIQGQADLEQLRQQLSEFRHSQPIRSRLPEPLWAAAAELATCYGVHRIARELHLDYTGLKKRVRSEYHNVRLFMQQLGNSSSASRLSADAAGPHRCLSRGSDPGGSVDCLVLLC
jgi:hypothetical protein